MRYKLSFVVFFILSCSSNSKKKIVYQNIKGEAQGTTFSITYSDSLSRNFTGELVKIFEDFDSELSTYKLNSLISTFNEKDSSINIDSTIYFKKCISKALFWKKKTNGFFDPVIKHILDFKKNNAGRVPDSILSASRDILFDESNIIKSNSFAKLDFNAIAQGYTVDVICAFLDNKKVQNYMVEVGGEIRVKGKNDKNENWIIGIESPLSSKNEREFQTLLRITNKAVATSGSYRKFKEIDGIRYSHAINPKTGEGVTHNLLSVTVISDSCIDADALATAFLVMGKDKAIKFIKEENSIIEAYFISHEQNKYVTTETNGFEIYTLK